MWHGGRFGPSSATWWDRAGPGGPRADQTGTTVHIWPTVRRASVSKVAFFDAGRRFRSKKPYIIYDTGFERVSANHLMV